MFMRPVAEDLRGGGGVRSAGGLAAPFDQTQGL